MFEYIVALADDPTLVEFDRHVLQACPRFVVDGDCDATRLEVIDVAADFPCEEWIKFGLHSVIFTGKSTVVFHQGALILAHVRVHR